MKRVLTTLILVLALVPLIMLMRWGGEGKAPWSEAIDGTRVRLAAPRLIWRPGDSVAITLVFRSSAHEGRAVSTSVPIVIVMRRDGHEVGRLTPTLPGPITILPDERPVVDAGTLVLNGGPGLYEITGKFGPWQLHPLKLRVVKERGGPGTPAPTQ